MILHSKKTQILMCKEPTDMRLGFDGLHKLARMRIPLNPVIDSGVSRSTVPGNPVGVWRRCCLHSS